MAAWTEGYVADIPYALGFYRETVPAHIAFAALAVGKHPGLSLRPRRVLELGIGMGLGFVINAASNPTTEFEGVDFNPLHIAHARGLVDEAELSNVHLREASFQDLAREAREGQHDLDLMVLHGILSWVSREAHEAIVDIARKRLKPGGMLYVSYNCMPGWAPVLPMQRLMRENAKRVAGRSDAQTASGVELMQALLKEGAAFFVANPGLKERIGRMSLQDKNYLAHEYLNENWSIFHFTDVAEMFGRAKLGFVGSATLAENIDNLAVPADVQARIRDEEDPIFQEMLRDIASNKQFRRDIFARGVSATTSVEQTAYLMKTRFALAVPHAKLNFKISCPIGEVNGSAEIYGSVASRLVDGPASLGEIAALKPFQNSSGLATALQALSLLVHSGQALPLPSESAADFGPAQRLNRLLADKMVQGRVYNYIAAPLAGAGLSTSNIEMLMLAGLLAGVDARLEMLAADLGERMKALRMNWMSDGKIITDAAASNRRATEEVGTFLTEKLPLWRQLGVL